MDPIVYMGCTASRKFKSFKGLKNWHFPEIQLHIPQREQLCMPTMSAHVCTQVCVLQDTLPIGTAHSKAHRGQAMA